MGDPLRVLIIEDSEDEALLLVRHLKKNGLALDYLRIDTVETLRSALAATPWDIILCDFHMPKLDAFAALKTVCAAKRDIPFLLVSGKVGEEELAALMRAGVHDIILKDNLARLAPAIRRELKDAAVRRGLMRAETLLHDAIESISEGFVLYDANDQLVVCNSVYKEIYHGNSDLFVPGTRLEDILRWSAKSGQYPEAIGRIEEWVAERMTARREGRTFEEQLADGRWILVNDSPTRDGGTVGIRTDITQLKQTEQALRESETQFRGAFQSAAHGIALVGTDGRWLKVNHALCEMLGYAEEELLQIDFQTISHPDDLRADLEYVRQMLAGEIQTYQKEKRYYHKDGNILSVLLSVSLVRSERGTPIHFVSQVQNLTERKKAEDQLRQAQKLEAVGQLTGGLAHDFNNLLTVMQGNMQLIQGSLPDERSQRRAAAALDAVRRGAELTKRLLAFSRKQALAPQVIKANELIEGMYDLLDRTLGGAIEIQTSLHADLWTTNVDPSQLESAILNLAINARDAMVEGGRLTVETKNTQLNEDYGVVHDEVRPGPYVEIAVTDNGSGIPQDMIHDIFQPFFTTKEPGKGSGLGMSMIFGFIKQSGGHVSVYSEEGHGTTVRLLLPKEAGTDVDAPAVPTEGAEVVGGAETILVVEDDAAVRDVAVGMLEQLGYKVLTASDGASALTVLDEEKDIDLLFTDIVMPGGMLGTDVAQKAKKIRPDINVVYTSGYAELAVLRDANVGQNGDVLSKPYEIQALAEKIRHALEPPAA